MLIMLLTFWGGGMGHAQDPAFSLMFGQRLYHDPAFAGMAGGGRAVAGFRDLYPGNDAAFITTVASWDQYVEALHGGYGITLFHDRSAGGMLATSALTVTYAYHLQISRNLYLNSGLAAALMQNHLDASKVVLPGMIPPGGGALLPRDEEIASESCFFPDFSVGFLFYSEMWIVGISAFHLMEPYRFTQKNDQTILPRKYLMMFNYRIPLGRKEWTLFPKVLAQWQGKSDLYAFGGEMAFKNIAAGVTWKKSWVGRYDRMVFSVGMKKRRMSFFYAYDLVLQSPLSLPGGNAHEIGVVMETLPVRGKRTIILPSL